MAFAFVGNASAAGTGVTSVDCNRPAGVAVGNFMAAVYAFEGVAAGSGPWIIPNIGQLASNFIGPSTDWLQACWQSPGATGVGIEVWVAIHESGTHQTAQFVTSQNVTTVAGAWSGEYNPTGAIITNTTVRVATTQQVTGHQPPAPAVDARAGELVIACAGDRMNTNFGTPSGFTNLVDANRAGAGTVEATMAAATISIAGNTGPITFPNNAAAATTPGTTATLCIVPAPATAGLGSIIDAGMPEELDIGPGYTLRVTALDPATGNPVSGVTVSNLIFTADQVSGTPEGLETGPFMLVPGPNA